MKMSRLCCVPLCGDTSGDSDGEPDTGTEDILPQDREQFDADTNVDDNNGPDFHFDSHGMSDNLAESIDDNLNVASDADDNSENDNTIEAGNREESREGEVTESHENSTDQAVKE